MRILMIHGRSQGGKDPDELKATWIATLKEGFRAAGMAYPDNIAVDFPFYADTLDALVEQANLPPPAELAAKGPGQNTQYEQFMQSALTELQHSAGISDAEVTARMDPVLLQEKGPQNSVVALAIARTLDDLFPGSTDFTMAAFLQDVWLYITHRSIARQVDQIINAKLTTEPTIVIAHSLGSIVGYSAIVNNRATLKLRKYITVGSPLGLRAVCSKLGVLQNPAGKDGWYNAYDHRDIVALHPLDNTYFPINPGIANYGQVDNPTDNRHGIIGYLNDAEVARQVAAALA